MNPPIDPDELALVVRAIASGTRGCCEWDLDSEHRLAQRPLSPRLMPDGIRELLIAHVAAGHPVIQVVEQRQYWKDRREFDQFYYKVVLPVDGLRHGLFVEVILVDDDPEIPSVLIVNAHEQQV